MILKYAKSVLLLCCFLNLVQLYIALAQHNLEPRRVIGNVARALFR